MRITGNGATLGGVYKLSSVYDEEKKEFSPKIKISSNIEMVTNPGNKEVYRVYDENNKLFADLITFNDEVIDETKELTLFDPVNTWKKRVMVPGQYKVKKMLKPIIESGKLVYERKTVAESKKYFETELDTLYDDNKRLTNPKEIYVDLSQKLYDTKIKLLSMYN